MSDRADTTPTRKRARTESNNVIPPSSLHRATFTAIRRGGGTRDMPYAEWRRTCVELLGDMVDGARRTLSWTDDGDAVAEVLDVVQALKNTLHEVDSMVSVDDDIFMSQPSVPAPTQDKGFDTFKSEFKQLFHSLEANLSSRISNVERRLGSSPLCSPQLTALPTRGSKPPPRRIRVGGEIGPFQPTEAKPAAGCSVNSLHPTHTAS
ncbi:hypothetical protein PLEOSDRAFT_161915 [Pleurotus ostreatus PC15]|uniref:Uncharacterized protein n=2 Tax=Pleurotus TaxID=5320 RepID=A0A067N8C1_PLEO1|nr:hypothetical protein CCMSSC00406_0010271 [Pleurotus cornucopiae]KDQ24104.1 hypothetical protein PLEOSDRAFT_161915 [Pleurotus ostreatus PC15]